jgi:tetratricopeptide (TPR) repeat protein
VPRAISAPAVKSFYSLPRALQLVPTGLLLGCLLLTPLLTTQPALAQSSDTKAVAEALFVEGRNLMQQDRFEEACKKFEASQRLDPGLGTTLNLAACYEKLGRTASAWAVYREAIPAARAAGSPEREELARERAVALEDRLSTLTVRLLGDMKGVDIEVRRNGHLLDRDILSTPVPVDPGEQKIVVTAKGYEPYETVIHVDPDGAKVEISIPQLTAKAEGPATGGATTPTDSGTTEQARAAHTTWAIVATGVGAVGAIAGGVFGALAMSDWDQAKAGCTDFPYSCTDAALTKGNEARLFADVSTIAFIAGGVGLGTAAVLWITLPKAPVETQVGLVETQIGFGPSSISVRGAF